MKVRVEVVLIITCFLLLALTRSALAQTPDESQQITGTQSVEPVATEVDLDTEVEVLRAQLETMRQYDQRLLETVYWALGISGGLLIVLVGYNAFSTFVLSDREKKNIARELEADIQGQFLDEREAIQKQLDGHAGRLDSLVERSAKRIYSELDKKMDELKYTVIF